MIQVDPGSPVPLYRQIVEQFRRLIALGALRPGDRLPAVRELAGQTRVNRNTAARAIQTLEREGLVRTRVGQGTFVDEAPPPADRGRSDAAIDGSLDRLVVEALSLRFPLEQLGPRLERRVARFLADKRADDRDGIDGGEEKP